MNIRLISQFFLVLFLMGSGLHAQEWVRTFPNSENFSASFSAVAPDGGVVVTDTRTIGANLMVAKLSASGTTLWEHSYSNSGVSASNGPLGCAGVYFNPDNTVYLINNRNTPGYDLILVDAVGNELSKITNSSYFWSQRTLRLANGDFMITRSTGPGLHQLKPDGTVVFNSNPGVGGGINHTNSIARADNGDYLMYVNGFHGSNINGVVLRANELGQQVAVYHPPYTSLTDNIAKGVDGNFMVVGSNDSLLLFNMSFDGVMLHQLIVDDPTLALVARDVVALPDGYLVAGSKGTNAAIWRLDMNGNLVSEQIMLPGYEAQFTSLTAAEGSYTVYGSGKLRPLNSNQSDVFVLKLNLSPIQDYGTVNGVVRLDPQGDCAADLSEEGIALVPVIAATLTDTFYTLTDANGGYKFILEAGDYLVRPVDVHPYLENCGLAQPVSVAGNDTNAIDFWVKEVFNCPLLQVSLSNAFMRRCFTNYYNVSYCNLGTAPAPNSQVVIVLDPNLAYTSASIPLASSSGDTLIFDVGDLDIAECGSFSIQFEMLNCTELEVGQSLCSSAHIYPDTVCGNYANWSGASMKVGGSCEGDSVKLFVTNIGTATTSQPIGFIVTEDNVILMQNDDVFNPLDTAWAIVPANGATWRMESEQEPNHPGFSYPSVTLEGCGVNPNGGYSIGYLPTLPQDDADYAHDINCRPIIASYDPNAKEAFPTGVGAAHYINRNTDLEYLLSFQNTGNDTAFTVVLRDTLPEGLDPATIEIGAGSHAFTYSLDGRGVLVFRFDQILLPDSTTNEPASHGWVQFRISQDTDLPLGTVLENSVAIYFDFNDPVITNTVFHTIGENFIEVVNDVSNLSEKMGELLVFPNPSGGDVIFELPKTAPESATFILHDHLGRVLRSQSFTGKQYRFTRDGLPNGIYFYELEINGVGRYSGKVVLK
ncbi:MAG: T9SS type A sorting domain-containing protein [Saprospiraceae bacterium]|nr:T9SS type A sorting domain-containing protein [Saprospiraceae bacterium]